MSTRITRAIGAFVAGSQPQPTIFTPSGIFCSTLSVLPTQGFGSPGNRSALALPIMSFDQAGSGGSAAAWRARRGGAGPADGGPWACRRR
jgi:hypothetical protein